MGKLEIQYPLIIGHRGYKKKYPENTIIAFKAAFDAGVGMIELDVTLTKDRQMVVIHDDTLDRTTSGTGAVMDQEFSNIKMLDAGSWFNSKYRGETIPTLEQVLDISRGRGLVNIEIKKNAYECQGPVDAIETQVVNLVQRKKMKKSVLISSFEERILTNIKKIDDNLPTGLLTEKIQIEEALERCLDLKVFSWHPNYKHLDQKQVLKMHKNDIQVFPYTVNSKKDYTQLIKMGVDGIFTDDPLITEWNWF